MSQISSKNKKYNLLHLELLSVFGFPVNYDLNQIYSLREINAAVVNTSGRQRMLCQRTALYSLRLVCAQNQVERENLRVELLKAINLIEKSHNGLICGDPELKLPGKLSEKVKAMYFEPPLNLDQQVCQYIAEVRALLQTEDSKLTQDNSHLRYILDAAEGELLFALDAVVSQYQKECEAEQMALDINRAQLYQQSCTATATAQAQAKELEKALYELEQAQGQLIHSERIASLGQLVASVAHEINNPISFIVGNLNYAKTYAKELLELLHLYQQEYPQPSSKIKERIATIDLNFLISDLPEVLSSMKIGADRICQIMLSLRSFSRMDEEVMQPMNIHEGIDSTLLILQSRLKPKGRYPGIQLIKEYGNLPPVKCHAGQLNQVFMNVLSNAIDALEMGTGSSSMVHDSQFPSCPIGYTISPTIWIRTEVRHPDYVTVRIADNGPGMTEEVKARLFERFFTTKPVGKGTGLGLSISYEIVVKKHGGLFRCISQPGEGCEFEIKIPIGEKKCFSNQAVNESLVLCQAGE